MVERGIETNFLVNWQKAAFRMGLDTESLI